MKSLYSRFALTTVGIMLLSFVLGLMAANSYYHNAIKHRNDEKNTKIARGFADYIEEEQPKNLEKYLESAASSGYQIYMVNAKNEDKFFGAEFRQYNLPDSSRKKVLSGDVYHGMRDFPKQLFVTGFFANELTNTVGVSFQYDGEQYGLFVRPDIRMLFNEVHSLLGWIIAIMAVLTVFFVLISSKFMVSPITQLTVATKEIHGGNFDVELDINRSDEIGQLAKSFKEMLIKLGQLDIVRSEFVSNVSHDIQTPLLNIQGYTKLLEKGDITEEERKHYFRVIGEEASRLSSLTQQLLVLKSVDKKEKSFMRPAVFNLAEQIKDLLRKYLWLLDEKGIGVNYSLPDIDFHGDPSLLYNVWENLLTNSMKYNKENGEIEILLSDEGESIKILFKDTGIGLTDEEQERIFDRFYRVDHSRSKVEGTGLGLSIAKSIVEMHEGSLDVESEPGKGSIFTVLLPKM
ncbi:HAMP domain-containing sensor histidine kinase [Bacillus massilinigeriensis]|uniref:HAMP domain-containing sensor histidine kinase n=1 Tax=Bacillus mediterraneensis TaxID=1805474 RepID=UPI0008F94921|nr:HAMP domain-containing sensor histidine kinase [Bacillus mediterraneensis]